MEQPFRAYLTVTVQDLLQKIGFEASVKTGEEMAIDDAVHFYCEITMTEGQNLLIGQHGANIGALLHIVRLIVRDEMPKGATISLDVNHYFEEKRTFLEREALEAVKEVEESGLPVTLRPMLSFERKMIHTLLAAHERVTTESVGVGEARKVLIKRRPVATPEEIL